MEFVDDANDRVIDGDKPGFQRKRGFASAFEIDQLAGASHARRIASNQRLAFWVPLLVERLNPQHRDAFESLIHTAGCQRSHDAAEQHYDTSSPSSSCNLASL